MKNLNSKPQMTAKIDEAMNAVMFTDNATKEQRQIAAAHLVALKEWQQAEEQAAQWANVDADFVEYQMNRNFRG